jgi:hypothetical protein
MDWQQILSAVVTAVVGIALPPLSIMLLNWLKNQRWVQKAHLEDFFAAMVPQVVQWVEFWADQLAAKGEKPSGEAKMAKFKELLKEQLPTSAKITDEELMLRAESELVKMKASLK